MAAKTKWTLLAFDGEEIKTVGDFTSKKRALGVLEIDIKKYQKYGMALIKKVSLGSRKLDNGETKEMFLTADAWNYTIEKGNKIYYRRNHHDLW